MGDPDSVGIQESGRKADEGCVECDGDGDDRIELQCARKHHTDCDEWNDGVCERTDCTAERKQYRDDGDQQEFLAAHGGDRRQHAGPDGTGPLDHFEHAAGEQHKENQPGGIDHPGLDGKEQIHEAGRVL